MGYGEVYCEFPCSEALVVIPKATEDVEEHVPKKIKITAPAVPPKATEDAPKKTKYAKLTVTKEVHDFFTSQDSDIIDFKRCEYDKAKRKAKVTISTEAAAMRSKENKLAMVRSCLLAKSGAFKDVVVLTGPSGQTLMPEATTVSFRNSYTIRIWGEGTKDLELTWNPMSTRAMNVKFKFSLDKPAEAKIVTWNLSLEQFLRASSIPIKEPTEDTSAQQSKRIEYDCNVDRESRDMNQFVDKTFYVTESSPTNHVEQKFTIKVPVVKK
eukprot:GDKJ01041428.1.p1 GENE.GDKJ01041428.1~~GDKJ01041428.1.p1  ORF type:complete len:268 (+),score=12.60 GDKJ01041428.1:205-1008(+)